MQVYAIKLFNFFRFGEKNNSIIMDFLPEYSGISLDDLYEQIKRDPLTHIDKVKKQGLTGLISIAGVIGGNFDLSNGSGKSTILESLCYAFYDQVVRRTANNDKVEKISTAVTTRINNEIPEDIKETYVEIIFEEGEGVYVLKRGRAFSKNHKSHSPILTFNCINEDEIDSRNSHRSPDTNESITETINMDYDIFVNSVLFGQGDSGKLMTGTDSVRKEMLINLLHLENIVSGCLENTRDKKNKKQKDIDELISQSKLLSEDLKSRPSTDNLKIQIKEKENNIADFENKSKEHKDNLEKLLQSDILKELESIKSEGQRVQNDLSNKKKQKESQTQEWINLLNNSESSIVKKNREIEDIESKQKDLNNKILANKQKIESFNIDDRKKILDNVEKAKKLKPQIIDNIEKCQDKNKKIYGLVVIKKSDIDKCQKEINLLREQINNTNNKDEFICDKCKSLVTRKHIEDELNKKEKEKSDFNGILVEKEKEHNVVSSELEEFQRKFKKIDEWISKEAVTLSEIKEYENNKTKDNDLIANQDEYKNTNDKFKKELVDLNKQKEQYQIRIVEIGKQYDEEINNITNIFNKLKEDYKKKDESAKDIKGKIEVVKNNLEEISKNKAINNSQIGSLKKEIENIENIIKKSREIEEKLAEEQLILNRLLVLEDCWGLEGLQTRIIKKYLPLLNIYIKEFMDVLSNGLMSVELIINNRSKIDIIIKGGSANTYEMLSGGEKNLCRMATSIGMAMLSFTRCSRKPELIALDEVFGSLDNSHIETVFKLLEKLGNKFNRVLVISHKAEINDRIPHRILVEKDEGVFGRSKIKEIT